MYLQSAAIDHQNNYAGILALRVLARICSKAWFTYKQEASGRPRVLEYHQDSHRLKLYPHLKWS